jgi:hypothetical protein
VAILMYKIGYEILEPNICWYCKHGYVTMAEPDMCKCALHGILVDMFGHCNDYNYAKYAADERMSTEW